MILLGLLELRDEEAREAAGYGPHGRPMAEATSPDADPADRRYGFHYETRVQIDHAQRKLNADRRDRHEQYPDEDGESLVWSLVRVDDGPPRPRPALPA